MQYIKNEGEEPVLKEKTFHKYLRLSWAERILKQNEFWFSAPDVWPDKFETQFLDAKYHLNGKMLNNPLRGRVFVFCMTGARSSEAYWNRCDDPCSVELNINGTRLLQVLKKCDLTLGKVYIGNVRYYKEPDVSRPSLEGIVSTLDLFKNIRVGEAGISEEDWVKTLFVKRDNFKYEKETRIVIVVPKKTKKKGIKLSYKGMFGNSDIIKSVIISPKIPCSECSKAIKERLFKLGCRDVKQSWLYEQIDKKYLQVNL